MSRDESENIDPRGVRYSIPTVASDELHFVTPTEQALEGAPQFHEDEWCQLEFHRKRRLPEIKRRLIEYKSFERKHRTDNGWSAIYTRHFERDVLVAGPDAIASIADLIGALRLPSPTLTTTSAPLGQVEDGFTLSVPGSVFLYGLADEAGVSTLGAVVARGGDDGQLARAFTALSRSNDLALVDWRSQMILVSVAASGAIEVWRA